MSKKITLLTISDHPLSPSGVGGVMHNIIVGLLKTGKFNVKSLGGAIRHTNYQPMKVAPYEDDWHIWPVDGYGNPDIVRQFIRATRPDIMFIMTDPRFWTWLWNFSNEIRTLVPLVYYHVWDNYPYPMFNKPYYESNDYIVTISKLTQDIVSTVAPNVPSEYLPHCINPEIFKPISKDVVQKFKNDNLKPQDREKMIFFYNSRNARRKSTGTLVFWFKEFLDIVGHDKAMLIMHTDTKDEYGQDLERIIEFLGMTNGEILFSKQKFQPDVMSMMYNMVDCTINISDAEGFGLSVSESLSCETPAIVTMTGGLQEQITNGKDFFGVGIEPVAKAVIGSQDIPWIFEDRLNKEKFINAMIKFYNTSKEEREEMGRKGKLHLQENYNFDKFQQRWIEIFTEIAEKNGSWETRKNYNSWSLKEV